MFADKMECSEVTDSVVAVKLSDEKEEEIKKAKLDIDESAPDETDSKMDTSAPPPGSSLGLSAGLPKMDISFGSASVVSKMLLGGGETSLEKVFEGGDEKEKEEKVEEEVSKGDDQVEEMEEEGNIYFHIFEDLNSMGCGSR